MNMKRISLLLSFVICIGSLSVFAQAPAGAPMLNYNALEKQLEKSNKNIEHDKKKLKEKTWFKRGELFQDIADVNTQLLRIDMPPSEVELYYGKPIEVKTQTNPETGASEEVHVYERVRLTYENGVLKSWEETEVIHETPFKEALAAYEKALELDEKGKVEDDLKENLTRMKRQLETRGIVAFSQQDFDEAFKYFKLYTQAGEFPVFEGQVDTVIYYNAALAATKAERYDEAIKFFKKAKEHNYGGETLYYYMKEVYVAQNDSAKALEVLQEGFEKNPEGNVIVNELINFYLTSGNADGALEYLDIAKKADPNNKTYHFAEGSLYNDMGELDKAIESYKRAIEIDPEYFDPYFNLGVLYYNQAVEFFNKANESVDDEEYKQFREQADKKLKQALEPMEKSHEINPDDLQTLETLKTIYYRLQMEDKHEEVSEILKTMEGSTEAEE